MLLVTALIGVRDDQRLTASALPIVVLLAVAVVVIAMRLLSMRRLLRDSQGADGRRSGDGRV